jgi:hypothetical protein
VARKFKERTFSFEIPSGMYSIFILAAFRVIVDVFMLNAKDDSRKHNATTRANSVIFDMAEMFRRVVGIEGCLKLVLLSM